MTYVKLSMQTYNNHTNYALNVVYKSKIENMAMVRHFEVYVRQILM